MVDFNLGEREGAIAAGVRGFTGGLKSGFQLTQQITDRKIAGLTKKLERENKEKQAKINQSKSETVRLSKMMSTVKNPNTRNKLAKMIDVTTAQTSELLGLNVADVPKISTLDLNNTEINEEFSEIMTDFLKTQSDLNKIGDKEGKRKNALLYIDNLRDLNIKFGEDPLRGVEAGLDITKQLETPLAERPITGEAAERIGVASGAITFGEAEALGIKERPEKTTLESQKELAQFKASLGKTPISDDLALKLNVPIGISTDAAKQILDLKKSNLELQIKSTDKAIDKKQAELDLKLTEERIKNIESQIKTREETVGLKETPEEKQRRAVETSIQSFIGKTKASAAEQEKFLKTIDISGLGNFLTSISQKTAFPISLKEGLKSAKRDVRTFVRTNIQTKKDDVFVISKRDLAKAVNEGLLNNDEFRAEILRRNIE